MKLKPIQDAIIDLAALMIASAAASLWHINWTTTWIWHYSKY
jgi:hypothetical protein